MGRMLAFSGLSWRTGVCFQAWNSLEYGPLVRIALPGRIGSWISLRCLLVAQAEVQQSIGFKWTFGCP